MLRKILLGFLFTICMIGISSASNIDGKWMAKMSSPDGEMEMVFNFKVDGETLTGTVESPMGAINITNGKVNGDDFSFDVDVNGMSMHHVCKKSGDTITLKVAGFDGNDMEMILTKVKTE
jgi:hypothetical protein